MSKHDLQARPICHRKRESIEARLAIVFAALAVSRWIEARTGWSIRKFVKTARCCRTIQIQAGQHVLTAADPLPDELRQALEAINHASRGPDSRTLARTSLRSLSCPKLPGKGRLSVGRSRVTELAERLRLFEPLLDELAAEFCLEAIGPIEPRGDPASDAYHRCEVKRHRIGEACASNREAVLDHADEIVHAIAHDHCPSGNRQLIEPLVNALGARQTMERILGYLETGSATERMGAAMAWYWAAPTLQYSTLDELRNDPGRSQSGAVKHSLVPGEMTPRSKNAEARVFMREFRPRIRTACLRAFLASEDPSDRRYFSQFLSLSLDDYPIELHPEVEAARKIAEQHPERFKQGNHGG